MMKKQSLFEQALMQHISQIKHEEKAVYRYMDNENFLDMFAEGKIRVSTLKTCRGYENPEKGDKEEAKETYSVTHMTSNDPNFYAKAEKLGMFFGSASNVVINEGTQRTQLPDGFVLCTTARRDDEKFAKDFGKFCVKIKNPDLFFSLIAKELHKNHYLYDGDHRLVDYAEQKYKDDELPPGKIGFVKRKKFSWQEEYRFLWLPKRSDDCQVLDLNIPEIKDICERVL